MGEGKPKDDISSEGDKKSTINITESQPPPQVYPFPPNYQGHPPPYPGYPTSNYHRYGPPPPPPPPPGYYQTTARNFVLLGPPQRSNGYKYARLLLTVIIVMFFGMSIMSLLTWLAYGSDIPVFYTQSLDMTLFSFDDDKGLNATWKSNVSVKNPSHKDEVSYDYVEAALVYDDHILDTTYTNPFVLGKTETWNVSFMFLMPNAKQKSVAGATWEKDIDDERRDKGSVTFDMRIIVNAVVRRDGRRKTSRTLRIFCADLEVVFPSPADKSGTLDEQYKECIMLSD